MDKESKELLLKDLCARLPYGVQIVYNNGEEELFEIGDRGYWLIDSRCPIEKCKPYLRPMSSMTEDEQDRFLDLIIPVDGGKAVVEEDKIEKYNEFIYSHHFDCKGLIEKGLAFEAPEEMYKID